MDKVKLAMTPHEKKIIEYNGVQIEVNSFMGTAEQGFLINKYLETYFVKTNIPLVNMSDYDYLAAEFALKDYIFQINTNIDTTDLDNDFYSDPVLWDKIVSAITNYEQFKDNLDYIVQEIKEQKLLNNQLGKVLSGLLDKLNNIFENISPEDIEKLQKQTEELAEKLKSMPSLTDKV